MISILGLRKCTDLQPSVSFEMAYPNFQFATSSAPMVAPDPFNFVTTAQDQQIIPTTQAVQGYPYPTSYTVPTQSNFVATPQGQQAAYYHSSNGAMQTSYQPQQGPAPYQGGYPTEDSYKKEDPVKHIYKCPDMYVGSDKRDPRQCWVFDPHSMKMQFIALDYVPASERGYLELVANACDNGVESRRARVDPGSVVIIMDSHWITITNYGLPIPVGMHSTGIPVPELIFGNLLTSSKYDRDRHGIGKNGIGAKAANVFSTEFMIEIVNATPGTRKRYQQTWSGNMLVKGEPVITELDPTIQVSSTTVRYHMDFARFQYDPAVGYPPEAFALYERHAAEISFTTKMPVIFNGRSYNLSDITDLALLYYTEEQVKKAIIYYIWPAGTQVVESGKNGWPRIQRSADPSILPDLEMMVLDTPDASHHISFANGMMTSDGGSHVEGILKVVSDSAVKGVNEKLGELISGNKKSNLKNKGKGKGNQSNAAPKKIDASEKRTLSVTLADVRPHLSLLISVRVVNPVFDSQAKTKLKEPQIKVPIPEELLKKMEHWQLLDRLYAAAEAKEYQSLTKGDGKGRTRRHIGKGIDANFAGKAGHSMHCILVVTEGDSAAGTASRFFSHGGHNARDYVGILPIRGKGLNVMGKSPLRILRNEEIKSLKAMLGLQENLNYLDPENYKTLRYGGGVYFFSDADDDGKHITSIELNLFFCRYPSLLAAGYCYNIDTPYLIINKGQTVIPFYSTESYESWKEQNPNYSTWKHRYIKGLGTLSQEEIAREYQDPHFIHFMFDTETPRAMQLAFHKKAADHRKEFMARWKSIPGVDQMREMPVSTYIYQNWTKYSKTNVIRALPNLLSGMKRTHMKVIQACILLWNGITFTKNCGTQKIVSIVGRTLEKVAYHHGDAILGKVIIGMCQNFVGALNMSLLEGFGNVGSREYGGADAAAARYPSAKPSDLFPYIFRPEDTDILEYMEDDGEKVEPVDFFPTVPLGLINNVVGIGTGHSCTTVNHHPLDCTHLLKLLLTGTPLADLPDLTPHYIGFTGTLYVIDRNNKKRNTATDVAANPMYQWQLQQQALQVQQQTLNSEVQSAVQPVVPSSIFNFEPSAFATATDEEHNKKDDDGDDDEPLDLGVELDEEDASDIRPRLALVTKGIYQILGNRIIITELPIGMCAQRYREKCQAWIEQKDCVDYIDRCTPDLVYFEIIGFKPSPSYVNLGLESHIPMSNMRFLDHQGNPVRYDTALDILYAFYCQRLPKYQLRKDHMLKEMNIQIDKLSMRMKFIQLVISRTVDINNRIDEDVTTELSQYQVDWLQVRDINVWSLTSGRIIKLQTEINELVQKRDQLIQTSKEQLWLNDIADFEKAAGNRFGPRSGQITITGGTGLISTPQSWHNSSIATNSASPVPSFVSGPAFAFM